MPIAKQVIGDKKLSKEGSENQLINDSALSDVSNELLLHTSSRGNKGRDWCNAAPAIACEVFQTARDMRSQGSLEIQDCLKILPIC